MTAAVPGLIRAVPLVGASPRLCVSMAVPGPGAGGQCGPSCQMPMTLPAGSRMVATRRFPSG
jgi:hypothetical protein